MSNEVITTPQLSTGVDMPGLPPAIDIRSFNSEGEEALALRYGRKRKMPEELTFEFTRDRGLLAQYNRIYEEEFKKVQNALKYRQVEDEHDRRASFLLVRQGNLCVGGGRLSTKTPRQPHLLPIESHGFMMESFFPDLKKKEMAYGQIGRICLLPEFRGGDITRRMFWHINRKAVALGLDIVFATAPILNARNNTKLCRSVGLDAKIYFNIPVPPYPMCEEIKMYLMTIMPNKLLVNSPEPEIMQTVRTKENSEA